MLYYDVVIVGGGPAGAACGIELLNQLGDNLLPNQVCLIDKAVFPRQKVCGGLVTQKTCDVLSELLPGVDYDSVFCDRSQSLGLFRGTDKIVDVALDTPLYFTDRVVFDDFLIKHYQAKGGHVILGQKVVSIDRSKYLILLENGERIHYQSLIGADGFSSVVRKSLDLSLDHTGFCLEVEVPVLQLGGIDQTRIYFDIIKDGYGWVFPKGDYYTVGVGGRYISGSHYKQVFVTFLTSLGVTDHETLSIKGAFVPFGGVLNQSDADIFLIGDAAGMVDPITGEGLYFALYSGQAVARSLLSQGNESLEYTTLTKKIWRSIREGYFLQCFFYSRLVQWLFYRVTPLLPDVVRYYCETQVSRNERSYSHVGLLLYYYWRDRLFSKKPPI